MSHLESQLLGAFSFFSFSKHVFSPVDAASWELMHELERISEGEVESEAMKLFSRYSERERRAYIVQCATDLHETHHFHTYLLTGAGDVMFQLFANFFNQNQPILTRAAENVLAGREPFSDLRPVTFNAELKTITTYFLGASLPSGEIVEQISDNPLTSSYRWGTSGNNLLPVVTLHGRTLPLGAACLFEGWTWALVRALVFRQFPPEYSAWYASTKNGPDLWVYTLLDSLLAEIFGHAYERLDPVDAHTAIAALALHSLAVDPRPAEDRWLRQGTHPGFLLAEATGLLWTQRSLFMSAGELDVHHVVRALARLRSVGPLPYSLADRIIDVIGKLAELGESDAEDGYLDFAIRNYYELSLTTVKAQVANPALFLNAAEWLTANRRDTLPRTPIAIGMAPDTPSYHMAFPGRANERRWFAWYLCTQLLLNLAAGEPACPLVAANIDAHCAQDAACWSLGPLLPKQQSCHWTRTSNKLGGDSVRSERLRRPL